MRGIIRDKALLRSMAKAAGDIAAMVQEGVGTRRRPAVGSGAEDLCHPPRPGQPGNGYRGRRAQRCYGAAGRAHRRQRAAGPVHGLSAVDRKINGLNKSDLLLLAARPGMGKTSMALNVALSAAKASGKTVAIFSLEMSKEQLVTRLLANEGAY